MSNWESALALQASSAKTTTGAGDAVDLGTRDRLLRQTLDITAVSGTGSPTLTVRLEASPDGETAWRTFATFTAATAAGSEKLSAVSPERFVRLAWTISGDGPSFTFAVVGTQGLCFANVSQLEAFGMPAAATATLSATTKAEALAASTEAMSSKLGVRYDLPVISWGVDVVQACCKITAYDLLSVRGFAPNGNDKNVRDRYADAMLWLTDVANMRANPIGLVDSTVDVEDEGIAVVDTVRRGWRQ